MVGEQLHFNGVQAILVFVSGNIHDFSKILLLIDWIVTSSDLFYNDWMFSR